MVWDVTHRCNLHCRHCYASARKAFDDELITEEALNLIDRLAKLGVAVIAFSGGEPLSRPGILQLISYVRDQGSYVAHCGERDVIIPKRAEELHKAGAEYVQISIDGADAKTHDEFRGIPGAFDRTIEGGKMLFPQDFLSTFPQPQQRRIMIRSRRSSISAVISASTG